MILQRISVLCRLANLQPELAVVNQHRISGLEFLRQICVGNAASMRVPRMSRRQSEHFSVLSCALPSAKSLVRISGPLVSNMTAADSPHRIPHAAEQIYGFTMTCMVSMRKIHSQPFMPAFSMARMISSLVDAGPKVHTILVFLISVCLCFLIVVVSSL